MKKSILSLLIALSFLPPVSRAEANPERGGGGVGTGGADTFITASALYPKKYHAVWNRKDIDKLNGDRNAFPMSNRPILGGLSSRETYAHTFEAEMWLDLDGKPELGRMELTLCYYSRCEARSFPIRSKAQLEDPQSSMLNALMVAPDRLKVGDRELVVSNGSSLVKELKKLLDERAAVLLAQATPSDPSSIQELKAWEAMASSHSRFYLGLLKSKFSRLLWPFQEFSYNLRSSISKTAQRIQERIQGVLSSERRCDPDLLQEIGAELREWSLGSRTWFDRNGGTSTWGTAFIDSCLRTRGGIFDDLQYSVVPLCGPLPSSSRGSGKIELSEEQE
jgi:hypothetical protein